jgi:hypothetical protein
LEPIEQSFRALTGTVAAAARGIVTNRLSKTNVRYSQYTWTDDQMFIDATSMKYREILQVALHTNLNKLPFYLYKIFNKMSL